MRVVDSQRGILEITNPGVSNYVVLYNSPPGLSGASVTIMRSNDNVNRMMIDPILASLRLRLNGNPASSRLDETEVTLEILSELFFEEQRTPVTMSAILANGRRIVITDPSEIRLQSSNTSIVSVDNNFVIAKRAGTAELNVTWVVCGRILGMKIIQITVDLDDHGPIFANDTQAVSVVENSPLGTTIATIFADDLDFARTDLSRRDTEYRFMNESDTHGGLFVLDRITGVISLNGLLDRERLDRYSIRIQATDREQRLAEQPITPPVDNGQGSESGSGSGSGSGSMLMPVGTTVPPTTATRSPPRNPIDMITVS